MNVRNSVLIALPALLVGLGAGFVFSNALDGSGDSADRARGPSVNRTEPTPESPAATPQAEGTQLIATSTAPERDLAPTPIEAASPRVSETQLSKALDGIGAPSVSARQGGGTITGFVRDTSGAPVAGVTVMAKRQSKSRWADPSSIGAAAPEDESLEDYLRGKADDWAQARGAQRRAVTAADGAYVLTGIQSGRSYYLSGYLEGYALDADGSSSSLIAGSRLDFTAEPVHTIPVQLVGPDGRAPEDGLVRVERGDRETTYAWSSEEPDLRLVAGRVTLRGLGGIDATVRANNEVVSSLASEERAFDVIEQAGQPLELVLEPRQGIVGRIRGLGSGNRPMARLLPVPASGEVDQEELANTHTTAWPNGDRFAFLDLAPGVYAVGLARWNESLLTHAIVEVTTGLVEVDLVVPEPDPERTLVVRATGPDGRPLRDLKFRWSRRSGGGSRSGGIQAKRRPDGVYALRPQDEYFEPWGDETSFTLTVTHAAYGDRPIELAPGQLEVAVAFEEPVSISLVVENYVGSGHEGRLQASIARVDSSSSSSSSSPQRMYFGRGGDRGSIDAEGKARFEALSPGEWRITLDLKTGEWQQREVATREVTVASGETTVRMTLPALYEVAVYAPGLLEGAWMQLMRKENDGETVKRIGNGNHGRLDADHRLVFEGVTAGEYQLMGNGILEDISVTVPCGEILVDAQEPNCFRVSIGDLGGLLYTKGLRAGDLVIGADGELFESTSDATFLFQGEGEVPLIVLRGGEEVTVTLPRGLMQFGDPGGSFLPSRRP